MKILSYIYILYLIINTQIQTFLHKQIPNIMKQFYNWTCLKVSYGNNKTLIDHHAQKTTGW